MAKAYLEFASGEGDRVGLASKDASELFIVEYDKAVDVGYETADPRIEVAKLRPARYPHPDRPNSRGLVVGELVKRERINEYAWRVECVYVALTDLESGDWQRRVVFSTRTEHMQVSLAHQGPLWTGDLGKSKLIGSVDYKEVSAATTQYVNRSTGKVYLEPTGAFILDGFDRIAGDVTFLYRKRIARLSTKGISQLVPFVHTTNFAYFQGLFPKWTMFIGNVALDDTIATVATGRDAFLATDVEVELLWRPAIPDTDLAGGWRIFHRRAMWKSEGPDDKGKVYPVWLENGSAVFDNFVVQEESDFSAFFNLLGGAPR